MKKKGFLFEIITILLTNRRHKAYEKNLTAVPYLAPVAGSQIPSYNGMKPGTSIPPLMGSGTRESNFSNSFKPW